MRLHVDDRVMVLAELRLFSLIMVGLLLMTRVLLSRVGVTTTRGFLSVRSGADLVSGEHLGL